MPLSGIGSSNYSKSAIVEAGGSPFFRKESEHWRNYAFQDVANAIGLPQSYIMGAGAPPIAHFGFNGQLTYAIDLASGKALRFASSLGENGNPDSEIYKLDIFSQDCTFYASEGIQTPVLKVEAAKRTGDERFIRSIRKGLTRVPGVGGRKQIGLGGVFTLESGSKYMIHVPYREFKDEIKDGSAEFGEYIKFCEVESGPLSCICVLLSADPTGGAMNNNPEHPHCFTHNLEGSGHFEYDTCPEEVRYVGYFAPAGNMFCANNPYAYSS